MLHLIDAKAKKINEEAWMMREIIFFMSSIYTIPVGLEAGRDTVNPGSASLNTRKMIQGFYPGSTNGY